MSFPQQQQHLVHSVPEFEHSIAMGDILPYTGWFDHLPVELIVLVFQWLIWITPLRCRAHAMTFPRAVCKTWLTIVDATPILWTDLVNAPLALALSKSKRLPLQVSEHAEWTQGMTEEGRTQRMVTLSTAAPRIWWLQLSQFTFRNLSPLFTPNHHGNLNFPRLQVLRLSRIPLTRHQWRNLIRTCSNLRRLDLHHLRGDFRGAYRPMEILPIPPTISLWCTIAGQNSPHYGLMFGLNWTKLQNVQLDVVCEDHEVALARHQDAVVWAQEWHSTIQRKECRVPPMTATIRLRAPQLGFVVTERPNVTSSILITCKEPTTLRFKLETLSASANGIPPATWDRLPSLVAPIQGSSSLVIHPAHETTMASFNPQAFIQSTKPTNVFIGRATHTLLPTERGDWLQTLWTLKQAGVGWPHIERIWTEKEEAGETYKWVKQQTGME